MLATTKGAEMRKGIVMTITAILALFATSLLACGNMTPEETILSYFEAYDSENADAMVNLETEGMAGYSREERKQDYIEFFGSSEIDISGLQMTLINQSESSTWISVEWGWAGSGSGNPEYMLRPYNNGQSVILTKTDGKWLIDSWH